MIVDILSVIFFIYILVRFRSILLKIVLLVTIYPLFVLILFKHGIPLSGILFVNSEYFSTKAIELAFNAYLIGELFFIAILFPLRNKIYEFERFNVDNSVRLLFFILLVLSSYGVLLTHKENKSFSSGSFYIVLSVLLLYFKKNYSSFITLLQLFFCLLLIAIGERVDSIITVILLLVMNGSNTVKEMYNKKIVYMLLLGLFVLGVAVSFLRLSYSVDFTTILQSFYSQSTVCDVLYVYLCGAEYFVTHGPHPEVINNMILGLIPGEYYGVESKYNYTIFLRENFLPNLGGGLFFTEGLVAFGEIGVIPYFIVLGFAIRYLFINKKKLSSMLFLLVMVMICRIIWYGMIYIYKPMILILLLYVIIISPFGNEKRFVIKEDI